MTDPLTLWLDCVSKVMESESKLKESLIVCDREREELESKCTVLERAREEQGQTIRWVWALSSTGPKMTTCQIRVELDIGG